MREWLMKPVPNWMYLLACATAGVLLGLHW